MSNRKNSGSLRSASIDGDNARVSDGKPRNEQDYGRRQQSDGGKSGWERHGYPGREKSVDEGIDSKEEKNGGERLQSNRDADRRDDKLDRSSRHWASPSS